LKAFPSNFFLDKADLGMRVRKDTQ
jgi:hypothetical protein